MRAMSVRPLWRSAKAMGAVAVPQEPGNKRSPDAPKKTERPNGIRSRGSTCPTPDVPYFAGQLGFLSAEEIGHEEVRESYLAPCVSPLWQHLSAEPTPKRALPCSASPVWPSR